MVFIVRHGQTEGNRAKLLQGRGSNCALNELGRQQAKAVRQWFVENRIEIHYVYASPLVRAVQTADIISGGAKIMTDDRLLEMDYGPYEGMDLMNPSPEIALFFSDFVHNPAPEGMETLAEVTARLGDFLDMIRQDAEHENILISTHAIAMKGALEYLTPESHGMYWGKHIRNCALYQVEAVQGKYTVPVEVRN